MKGEILIIFILNLTNICYNLSAQPSKPKHDLYFLINLKGHYIAKYKKVNYPCEFDLEIVFNIPCLVINQKPYFYKYRDSVKVVSKSSFFKKNYNILPYDKFINIICKEGNNASLIVKYNIYFIEEAEKDKFLLYKVLYATPVPDDRNDNIISGDKTSIHNN